jgi:cell division transport system ATP-binding protein
MSTGAPILKFTSATKAWARGSGGLQKVSFAVSKGEFVFLTGPSGAGKSTVLKLCYMDEKPSSGEVRVSGVSSASASRTEISQLRRKLGIVFQDFRLLEDRTAWANVAFALEVTGTAAKVIPGKVQKVLERVGLGPKMQSMPSELSGGEQQRVAIARALVNDPFVLLADEPTGNLDDRASRAVFQLLKEINNSGTAVMMATHDLDLVRTSGFRSLELNRGALVYDSGDAPLPEREL